MNWTCSNCLAFLGCLACERQGVCSHTIQKVTAAAVKETGRSFSPLFHMLVMPTTKKGAPKGHKYKIGTLGKRILMLRACFLQEEKGRFCPLLLLVDLPPPQARASPCESLCLS